MSRVRSPLSDLQARVRRLCFQLGRSRAKRRRAERELLSAQNELKIMREHKHQLQCYLELSDEQRALLDELLAELGEAFLPQLRAQLAPYLTRTEEGAFVLKDPHSALRVLSLLLRVRADVAQENATHDIKRAKERAYGVNLKLAECRKEREAAERRAARLEERVKAAECERRALVRSASEQVLPGVAILEKRTQELREAHLKLQELQEMLVQVTKERDETQNYFSKVDERIHEIYAQKERGRIERFQTLERELIERSQTQQRELLEKEGAKRARTRAAREARHKALIRVLNAHVPPPLFKEILPELNPILEEIRLAPELNEM